MWLVFFFKQKTAYEIKECDWSSDALPICILKSEIEKAVKKLYGPHGRIRFSVSVNGKFGDYSSNVAMVAGGNPKENAQKIKEELEKSKKFNQYIEKTEIVNGFLNFTLSKEGLMKGLKSLGKKKKTAKGEPHRKRINVEFISANPTGELHVGHARSAFFGDALANTLEAAGDRKSTRLNSSHIPLSRMPSSA